MRYVAIEKAKDNMVLAMPIYDSINRVLLATGTIMTRDYIRKLKARGLPGFYVEDELAKDIEVQDIVTQELRHESCGTDCGTDSVTAANPSGYD